MKTTLKTRKPINELTLGDLSAFPVWEFATDEEGDDDDQDETWVRPIDAREVPLDAESLSVAAEFEAPKGKAFRGCVQVNTFEGFEAVHAAIITDDDYIFIPWSGYDEARKDARAAAKKLGLKTAQLFPLKYRLMAVVQGEGQPRVGIYEYGSGAA